MQGAQGQGVGKAEFTPVGVPVNMGELNSQGRSANPHPVSADGTPVPVCIQDRLPKSRHHRALLWGSLRGTRCRIPKLGHTQHLEQVGLNAFGEVQVEQVQRCFLHQVAVVDQ